jgi:hypothetical protein
MQEYNNMDQHIHQLSQTIAKFGRSFVEVKKDDSHTNLRFDFVGRRIFGRWANINNHYLVLTLNIDSQDFQLLDPHFQEIASFKIVGKTQDEVESDIAQFLTQDLEVNEDDFLKAMHFEIPTYNFKNDTIQKWSTDSLTQWMNYRFLANQACVLFIDYLNVEAEIRIWPHHFDTGVYTEVNNKIGLGFGWAMADGMMDEAYYYFSVYGLNNNTVNYASIEPLSAGKWITGEQWNGAVLPLSEANIANIQSFLRDTSKWALS